MARRKSSVVEDVVLLPWWVTVVLAVLAYLFLPAFLPSTVVEGGFVGIITVCLFALAAVSALRAWNNRRVLEAQTGLDSLRELPWKRFEDLLGEAYRRQGYRVEETIGGGADGGVDLILRRGGEIILVQCKRWKGKPVPVQIVRELYGVLHDRRASAAKLVATARFTPDAMAFAKGKPIELVDSDALLELLRGVQTSGKIASSPSVPNDETRRSQTAATGATEPLCPICNAPMVERTAKRGGRAGSSFWGCPKYPDCRGTRAS